MMCLTLLFFINLQKWASLIDKLARNNASVPWASVRWSWGADSSKWGNRYQFFKIILCRKKYQSLIGVKLPFMVCHTRGRVTNHNNLVVRSKKVVGLREVKTETEEHLSFSIVQKTKDGVPLKYSNLWFVIQPVVLRLSRVEKPSKVLTGRKLLQGGYLRRHTKRCKSSLSFKWKLKKKIPLLLRILFWFAWKGKTLVGNVSRKVPSHVPGAPIPGL